MLRQIFGNVDVPVNVGVDFVDASMLLNYEADLGDAIVMVDFEALEWC